MLNCATQQLYYYYNFTNSTNLSAWEGACYYATNETPLKTNDNWTVNWTFNFYETKGEGFYRFYSIAVDNASNREDSPVVNDTGCAYDGTPPNLTFKISRDKANITSERTYLNISVITNEPVVEVNANVTYLDDLTHLEMVNVTPTKTLWNGSYLVNGNVTYTINASAVDRAGNVGKDSGQFIRHTWFNDTSNHFNGILETADNVTITSDGNITLALNSTERIDNGNFAENLSHWVVDNGSLGKNSIYILENVTSHGNVVRGNTSTGADISGCGNISQNFSIPSFPISVNGCKLSFDWRKWSEGARLARPTSQDISIELIAPDGTVTVVWKDTSTVLPAQSPTKWGTETLDITNNITPGQWKIRLVWNFTNSGVEVPGASPKTGADWDNISINFTCYYKEGYFVSKSLNATEQVLWGRIWWNSTVPEETFLGINVSASLDNVSWAGWKPCINRSWVPNVTSQYLKYRINLSTINTSRTPALDNLTIEFFKSATSNVAIAVSGSASLEEFSHLYITFSQIKVYDGIEWSTIRTEPKTVDILTLARNNATEILGIAKVKIEKYSKIYLHIDSVVGILNDTGEKVNFELLTQELEVSYEFVPRFGGVTPITVYFDLAQCVQIVEEKYQFTPAVKEVKEDTYSFDVNVEPPEINIKPGKIAEYNLTINNTGTAADTYYIELTTNINTTWINISATSVTVSLGKSKVVKITVTVPPDIVLMKNTTYTIEIKVRSSTVQLLRQRTSYLTIIATKESKIRYIITEVEDLITTLEGMNISAGIKHSLQAKLEATQYKLNLALNATLEGKEKLANNMLTAAKYDMYAFVNEVEALKGKKISEEDADILLNAAETIIEHIDDAIAAPLN